MSERKTARVVYNGQLREHDPEHIMAGRIEQIRYVLGCDVHESPARAIEQLRRARVLIDEALADFAVNSKESAAA